MINSFLEIVKSGRVLENVFMVFRGGYDEGLRTAIAMSGGEVSDIIDRVV